MQWTVGVVIELADHLSAGMGVVSRGMMGANAHATELNKKLKNMHYTMQAIQQVGNMGGAMFHGASGALEAMLEHGTEMAHGMHKMNQMGMSVRENAEATTLAWKSTSIATTTATENLATLLELRGSLGNWEHAKDILPGFQKSQVVMRSSGEMKVSGDRSHMAREGARAIDLIAGFTEGPKRAQEHLDQMVQSIAGLRGQIGFKDFHAVAQQAGSARYGYSDEYRYRIAPTFMMENKSGGGSAFKFGTQEAAFFKTFIQGSMTVQAARNMAKVGIIDTGGVAIDKNNKADVLSKSLANARELAKSNPFAFINDYVVKKIETANPQIAGIKNEFKRHKAISDVLNSIGWDRNTGRLVTSFAMQPQQAARNDRQIRGTPIGEKAYEVAKGDPLVQRDSATASMNNALTSIGKNIPTIIAPALTAFAAALNVVANFFNAHPLAANVAVFAIAAIAITGGIIAVAAPLVVLGLTLSALGAPIGVILLAIAGAAAVITGLVGTITIFLTQVLAGKDVWASFTRMLPASLRKAVDDVLSKATAFAKSLPGMAQTAFDGALKAAAAFAIQLPQAIGKGISSAATAATNAIGDTIKKQFSLDYTPPSIRGANTPGKLPTPTTPGGKPPHIASTNIGDIHFHHAAGADHEACAKKLLSMLNQSSRNMTHGAGVFNSGFGGYGSTT